MKHLIDIDTWERKENYLFFRDFHNSWIAMTSEVDCTEAYAEAKAQGRSFFLYYLYAILRAANEIKEFRYRWDKHGAGGLPRYGRHHDAHRRAGKDILHGSHSLEQ